MQEGRERQVGQMEGEGAGQEGQERQVGRQRERGRGKGHSHNRCESGSASLQDQGE